MAEYGLTEITILNEKSPLFSGIKFDRKENMPTSMVLMSHGDHVLLLPPFFTKVFMCRCKNCGLSEEMKISLHTDENDSLLIFLMFPDESIQTVYPGDVKKIKTRIIKCKCGQNITNENQTPTMALEIFDEDILLLQNGKTKEFMEKLK